MLHRAAQLTVHYCIFVGAFLYSFYRFYETSFGHVRELYGDDWDKHGECVMCWRPRDGTDLEWQTAKRFFIGSDIIWFAGHSLGFLLVRKCAPQLLSLFIVVYSSFVVIGLFTVEVYFLFLLNSFVYILVDQFVGRSLYNLPHYFLFVISVIVIHRVDFMADTGLNLLAQIMLSWLNAKCLSASIDRSSNPRQNSLRKYLIRRFAYLFYFPPLFFGPIYHSSDFDHSMDKLENGFSQFASFSKRLLYVVRIFSWAFFFEVSKQFILSSSFQYYLFLLERFDRWSIAGYGFALTIMFYLKYLVIYGVSKCLAEFDGLEAVIAPPPECIAHMHRTSYLWRKFDQGLYKFLVKYFYKPLTGRSYTNPLRKLAAGVICFGIIALWHGPNIPVLIWVSLNVFLSVLEIVGTQICHLSFIHPHTDSWWFREITAIVGAPYLAMAYLSNVFFLSNTESGVLVWNRLVVDSPKVLLITMVVFWSGNHVCAHANSKIGRGRKLQTKGIYPLEQ